MKYFLLISGAIILVYLTLGSIAETFSFLIQILILYGIYCFYCWINFDKDEDINQKDKIRYFLHWFLRPRKNFGSYNSNNDLNNKD